MIYEKLPFQSVQNEIEKIFNNHYNGQLILTPDSIAQFAISSGVHLQWRPILNWARFEDGNYAYSDQDFLDIVFAKVKPGRGKTIIVTDECFRDQMAFSIFYFSDVIQFMDKEFPALFNMEFPQPFDYIFLQPDIRLITMIHHNGIRTQYQKP